LAQIQRQISDEASPLRSEVNKITDNTDPPLYPKLSVHTITGKSVIVISVEESINKPHLAFGRAFKRVGTVTKRMSRDEYERILKAKDEMPFEMHPVKGATLQDFSQVEVEGYTQLRQTKLGTPPEPYSESLLQKLRVVVGTDGGQAPTVSGILLFGSQPNEFIETRLHYIRCARFKGKDAGIFIDQQDVIGTLRLQIDEAMAFVRRNIRFGWTLEHMPRQKMFEYPLEVIKEAITNAVAHLFNKLSKKASKQWVLEGDIRGCFDNISHEHILKTLKSWGVKRNITNIIERMMKAKVLFKDVIENVDTGTPQGGILSPMLANVALTALDDYCYKNFGIHAQRSKKRGGNYIQNPIVRYADDFVIVCKSKQEAEVIKGKIATFLKDAIGLELSNEKTKITHIAEGFDFLGFNIRKYTDKSKYSKYYHVGKLLIKPQKEKVINFLRRMQEVLSDNKTAKQEGIIRMINPMIQGFGMYYRFAVSKKTFSTIDSRLWHKLWRWAKRRHPKKGKKWIMRKYFTMTTPKWVFKDEIGKKIRKIAYIPIVRFVMLKTGMRIHADDKETREYWQKRVYTNALSQVYTIKIEKLMKSQKGICPCCGDPITRDDIADSKVHAHLYTS